MGTFAISPYLSADKIDSAEEAHRTGVLLARARNYSQAIPWFDRAIEIKKNWEVPYAERASANYHLKQFDKAIADYGEAIRIRPDWAAVYNGRSLAYSYSGRVSMNRFGWIQLTRELI